MRHALESVAHKRIAAVGLVSHTHFQEAFNRSLSILQNIQPGRVLAIVGPSRAGKSQLLSNLVEVLMEGIKPHKKDDVPILRLEADLGNQQRMSLKEFAIEALQELHHPVFAEFASLTSGRAPTVTRLPEPTLRPMLIKALKARRTMYMFVDEAHHLLMTTRKKLQSDILDALKNICNKAGVVLVLVGGYSLLRGLFESAHFNGRLELLHFPPYTDSIEDLAEYTALLTDFQLKMNLSKSKLLVSNVLEIREIYWGTLGATIDGLREAESRRIARKAKTLEIQDIRATRLPKPALQALRDDIEFGARFFAIPTLSPEASGAERDSLAAARASHATKKSNAPSKPEKPKEKSKPFRRKPVRRQSAKVEIK